MAATVIINRLTGSGPTKSNITGINTVANASDAHQTTASGSSNPIKIPASGTNYSFWVSTRLEVTVAPAGTINNIKWYTDGANSLGTGVACRVNTASAYVQATGTAGTTGDVLNTSNHASLAGATSNAFTYTSGSPLSVTGTITATTGDLGHLVVYQIEVGSTASPGPTGSETFTWSYDET